MQSLPADSLLKLLGQSPSKPGAPARLDVALAGNEAFASALELLLTGMPPPTSGGDAPNSTDLATLLLMGQPATNTTNAQSNPSAVVPNTSSTATDNLPIQGMPTDATALAALMTLMPQPTGVVAKDAKIEPTLSAVPVDSLLNMPVAAKPTASPSTNANASSIVDPALLAATSQIQFPLPTVTLPSQSLPETTSDLSGTATVVGGTSGPVVTQTEREFLSVPLPVQPNLLVVSDQPNDPLVESAGQGSALVPKSDDSQPVLDINSQSQSTQGTGVSRPATALPLGSPTQVEVNQVVTPTSTQPTVPTKADILAPIPLSNATLTRKADQSLSTKLLDPSNAGSGKVEMRSLTSKASELGIQSLAVRLGNDNSKSAERLRALSSIDESVLVRTISKDSTPLMQAAQPTQRNHDSEPPAINNQPSRKKTDPLPPVDSTRSAEPATKSNTQTQDASVRPSLAPREVTTDRTESAPAPRFVVDEPKPIRVPGQITVRMEPSNLGPLTIDLQSGTDGIIARLRFGSEAARATVERDITGLHRALSDAGIRVERLDIVGVSPTNERSGMSSQTPQDHQAPQRDAQSQGRNNQPGDRPAFNQRERGHRQAPAWNTAPQSPWVAMNKMASSLNLVA